MSEPSALDIWRDRLEALLREEAITADHNRKFQLKYDIAEAREKMSELESNPDKVPAQAVSVAAKADDQGPTDIGIVVALKEEFRELFRRLPSHTAVKDEQTGHHDYLFEYPSQGDTPYRCAATFFGEMGPTKASIATEQFNRRRNPKTIVMLGIAGAIDGDLALGDVVLGRYVNNYLHRGKVVEGEASFELKAGGDTYRCSDDLTNAVNSLEFAHAESHQAWEDEAGRELEQVEANILDALRKEQILRDQPRILAGPIACGPVVGALEAFVDWLKSTDRNYAALEMESGGVLASIYSHADAGKTLILRGISDFADSRKKRLDASTKGLIRQYAMGNTIRLLWKLLEAEVFPRNP